MVIIIIQVVIKALYIHLLRNKNYKIIHLTILNLWPILYISKIFKNQIFIVNSSVWILFMGTEKKILSKIYEFLIPYTFINKNQKYLFFM